MAITYADYYHLARLLSSIQYTAVLWRAHCGEVARPAVPSMVSRQARKRELRIKMPRAPVPASPPSAKLRASRATPHRVRPDIAKLCSGHLQRLQW